MISFFRDLFGFFFEATAHMFGAERERSEPVRTRESGTNETFARAIARFARQRRAQKRDGRWVTQVAGVEIAMSVVTSSQRGHTWFAEVRAVVDGYLGAELVCKHLWNGPLPGGIRPPDTSRSFPALDAAWSDITRYGAHVVVVCDGRRVTGWIDEPLSADDIGRVAVAVSAIARWDAGFAYFLERLPDATPADDADLSPAVQLAPDGVRIGLRGGAETVVQLAEAGIETVWPEVVRDRERILAAVEELRSRRSAASGPYR